MHIIQILGLKSLNPTRFCKGQQEIKSGNTTHIKQKEKRRQTAKCLNKSGQNSMHFSGRTFGWMILARYFITPVQKSVIQKQG